MFKCQLNKFLYSNWVNNEYIYLFFKNCKKTRDLILNSVGQNRQSPKASVFFIIKI